MPEKILKIQEVLQAISAKGTASRVVFSSGAFDLFHYGHFHALKKAARLGNVLVVQIDGNELVRKRKGNDRPCLDEALRAEMVSSLEFVDFVFVSNHPSESQDTLALMRPNFFVRALRDGETDQDRNLRQEKIRKWADVTEVVWLEQTPEISTSMLIPVVAKNGKKHSMEKFPTVSVGIIAYNEEANIGELLRAVLRQREESFSLSEIIVVSDGSTDGTVYKVREIKDERIRLIESKERIGKVSHLNLVVKEARGELLVLLDADVLPATDSLLREMVEPFLGDESLGLVSVRVTPLPAKRFFERVINYSQVFKESIFVKWNGGNNFYSCYGRARAFSRGLLNKMHWPPVHSSEDVYSYLFCIEKGFKFRHLSHTSVIYKSPDNLSDHKKQSDRFRLSKHTMRKYFSRSFVDENYRVPLGIFLRELVVYFFKNPLMMGSYLFISILVMLTPFEVTSAGPLWAISPSSKKL